MAKTRGAKSSSPSTRLRIPKESPVQAAIPEPPRPLVVPPPVEDAPMSPPLRRYQTRKSLTMVGVSSSQTKKSGSSPRKKKAKVSEPIDLIESSSESPSKPQPSQPPAKESQIPSGMTPKVVIKRPMVTQPPIEGARHIAEALRIPYVPARLEDYRVWTHPAQSDIHWVQRKGVLLETLFKISEGFFFGPYHLIMAAFLYFEEKVHRKKLLRADVIPLLFPILFCQILEHLGYPIEPQLERRRICREIFTLDKWTSMTAYGAVQGAPTGPEHPEIPHPKQPKEPQPVEIPVEIIAPAPTVASTEPIPERPMPHFPSIGHFSEHPHSADDSSSCSSRADYRHLDTTYCHPEQTLPSEEPTIGEAEASEPSSSHHSPATI
ncbi:hypothetical protein CK203_066016 [Vitis vinifera]|uniref:Uncharacterized protein n=1 Tax=Vitis vinifera TaxID=29760 RepID=A0A438G338_VITVI|nr:hypothetical protein CK203_066016 [Vitis vinifera]